MVELEEGEFIIDIEEGYRTVDVEGAIVTSMGIVESEKGGIRAFIDFDDNKGMATYNMVIKGEPIGQDGEPDHKIYPGFLDVGKIIASLKAHGFISIQNPTKKTWRTDPPIVGQQIWIKCVKTSTGTDGKEYKSLIEVTRVGSEETTTKPAPKPGTKPGTQAKAASTPVRGTLTTELLDQWKDTIAKVLTDPLNETGINQAVKKLFPNEPTGKNETHRKALADVRVKALAAMVKDGTLEMTEDAKYMLAV